MSACSKNVPWCVTKLTGFRQSVMQRVTIKCEVLNKVYLLLFLSQRDVQRSTFYASNAFGALAFIYKSLFYLKANKDKTKKQIS